VETVRVELEALRRAGAGVGYGRAWQMLLMTSSTRVLNSRLHLASDDVAGNIWLALLPGASPAPPPPPPEGALGGLEKLAAAQAVAAGAQEALRERVAAVEGALGALAEKFVDSQALENLSGQVLELRSTVAALREAAARNSGRGFHSFPFQLNLGSSVHCITQLNS